MPCLSPARCLQACRWASAGGHAGRTILCTRSSAACSCGSSSRRRTCRAAATCPPTQARRPPYTRWARRRRPCTRARCANARYYSSHSNLAHTHKESRLQIREDEPAIQCTYGCSYFFHRDCTGLTPGAHQLLLKEPFSRCLRPSLNLKQKHFYYNLPKYLPV